MAHHLCFDTCSGDYPGVYNLAKPTGFLDGAGSFVALTQKPKALEVVVVAASGNANHHYGVDDSTDDAKPVLDRKYDPGQTTVAV